jgi:hypothetical protein
MRVDSQFEGALDPDAMPDEMRTPEERYWLEQAMLERQERGELPESKPIKEEWSTVAEVAGRRRVKPKTVRKNIHDGSLEAIDISSGSDAKHRRNRIHRDAEKAWWEAKRKKARTPRSRTRKPYGRSFGDLVGK